MAFLLVSTGSAEQGGADMRDGSGDEKSRSGGRSALLLRSREAGSAGGEYRRSSLFPQEVRGHFFPLKRY